MAILKNYPDTTTPLTVENLLDFFHPIGSYYDTSDTTFDPNVAWGGTWELDTDGTVLASKSSTSGSILNTSVGSIVGEDKHTLTVNEIPSHRHGFFYAATNGSNWGISLNWNAVSPGGRSGGGNGQGIDYEGGGQAHNNVQRTKIVNRWHRTA